MTPEQQIVHLLDEISKDTTANKVKVAELTVEIKQVAEDLEKIQDDRSRTGERYQSIVQRIAVLETKIDAVKQEVTNVETRAQDALVNYVETVIGSNSSLELRLNEKIKEAIGDNKYWIRTIIGVVLSILAGVITALVLK